MVYINGLYKYANVAKWKAAKLQPSFFRVRLPALA